VKPKMLVFLVIFCLGLGFLVVEGLCTTSQRLGPGGKEIRYISDYPYPPETMQDVRSPGRYSLAGFKDEADCFALDPDSEVPYPAVEHDLVGSTWYDFQKNGSMGRMISVTSADLGGYRHVSWMWTAGVYPGVERHVYARSKLASWSTTWKLVDLGNITCGYTNQAHMHDGVSVVMYHSSSPFGGKNSSLAIADNLSIEAAYTRYWDLPDDMSQEASANEGSWPKGDVMYCRDTTTAYPADTVDYLHIIETESVLEAGAQQWIGYLRCYVSPTNIDTLYCQTPTTGGEIYAINKGETFQDEIYGFAYSCDISGVVATGRGIGDKQKVAIAYMPMVEANNCNNFHNVGYLECEDNGDAWIGAGPWPPTTNMITDYLGDNERAFHDVSACYDYDDNLHVVWTTCGVDDPMSPTGYYPGIARIYHWCAEHGISQVASKIQEGANPSAHCINTSKVIISPKDPMYHTGGDSVYLFCIWAQVDSSDQNAAGDQGNADIFGSGSFDGGNTWGKVLNLTGTHTPGCTSGVCVSEHMPSMATNMLGGDLHIEYICDRDAGFGIYDEGAWTQNYVMYLRLHEWPVTPGPRGEFKLIEPPHWFHPPMKVLPNQTRTISMMIYSIGNEALNYTVDSDHPCIQVNVGPAQLAPKDSIQVNVLVDGTGVCNGTFIAGNVILSTDEAGGKVENLPVHAVVSDEYYECPRDPATVAEVYNGVLAVRLNANCQMEMDDSASVSVPDSAHQVFFRGGTIVATTQGADTLVGRWMGDNDLRSGAQDTLHTCEVDWDYPFWFISTKQIFIEATHLPPPAHLKWWWWEMAKGVKIFKPTRSDVTDKIVIQHVTVRRQDPPGWWPNLDPFTNYEDTYIGMAWDIDCPYDTSYIESARNEGGYDATNQIAYLRGWDYTGAHPQYNDYYAGIALANCNMPDESTVPYGAQVIKNNMYLYPTTPWGWKDGQLYQLAATPGPNIQDPDSMLDRSIVLTAQKIDAGTDANRNAYFTVVHAIAPGGGGRGLADLQEYVDSARVITNRMTQELCGDVNDDGIVNVGDVVYVVGYLYKSGPVPICPASRGDVNNDGIINVGDVVYLVGYLYKGGPAPVCWGMWFWR
jgi:hypothetical protein